METKKKMTESTGRLPAQVDVSLGINTIQVKMNELVRLSLNRAASPELNDS